jgi:hypothetical protein
MVGLQNEYYLHINLRSIIVFETSTCINNAYDSRGRNEGMICNYFTQ